MPDESGLAIPAACVAVVVLTPVRNDDSFGDVCKR